jgi:ABC-2 type transport system ATP-binding protein
MTDEPLVRVDRVSVRYGKNLVLTRCPSTWLVAPSTLCSGETARASRRCGCLLGLQKPTSGRVLAFGGDIWTDRARLLARAAYVPETSDAPGQIRVRDAVAFHAAMYPTWDAAAVQARLTRVGVPEHSLVASLSKGQRALFTLALALGSKPELLVLDDPTLGLDVVARNDFFSDFIGELADRGTTVILTTHDLSGVEGIADRVGILQGARLSLDQEIEALKLERGQSLEQIFTDLTRGSGRQS